MLLPLQTVSKLFELYLKLRELGHPEYLSEGHIPPNTWTHEVSNLRNQYTWLLYFSVPKMLRLYSFVSFPDLQGEDVVDRLLHEISFLAVTNTAETQKLRLGIQVITVVSLVSVVSCVSLVSVSTPVVSCRSSVS